MIGDRTGTSDADDPGAPPIRGRWRRPTAVGQPVPHYPDPVRVLLVSAWPPWPSADGARLVLHHHLSALGPRHDITLIAGDRRPHEPQPEAPGGVRMLWYGPPRRGPIGYLGRRWTSVRTREPADLFRHEVPELVLAFEDELDRNPPDVVHLMGAGTARLVGPALAAGVPVVHMPIDAWRLSYGMHETRPGWRRAIEAGQRRKVLRHERIHLPSCAAVVVVAERDAAALREAVPGIRVDVVPNGIEPGPEPGRIATAPTIGLHGVMSTRPNRAAAIALARGVLPLVQAGVPGARALVIGRDPTSDVRRLARPDVEVTGAVDDIRQALGAIAVYVAPMHLGSGIKNKVLEAMAAGLPVVSTSAALEGIGDGPGVIRADTAADMAAAVVRLLRNPEERHRVGAAARERAVRDFGWDRSALAIERIWHEVATEAARPPIS